MVMLSGLFFRFYQLPGQILVDDEWHAVHQIIAFGYPDIFNDFGTSDHCIPLSLFYEFLLNNLWISEFLLRLPAVAAGFLALLIIPLMLAKPLGTRAAMATACLLAISPLHVFYSRLARPYAISMLLSFISLAYLPVANATALAFLGPLISLPAASILLGEVLTRRIV